MGMTLDLTQGQAQMNINGTTKPSSSACEFCALKTQHIWNLDGGRVWLYAGEEGTWWVEPDLPGDHTSKGRGGVAGGDWSLLLNQMDFPTSTSDFFPSMGGQEAEDPR